MHWVEAGSGHPLVLVHGWPQSWYEWRKVIPALAERFRVIAPDLRGLGDSEKPVAGYDKRALASDVRALLQHLGIGEIGLVGHDWGGAVSFWLAYDHPEMVERLMILDMIPGLARKAEPLDLEMALKYWHVFFHGGKPDFAEKIAGQSVREYLSFFLTSTDYNYSPAVFSAEDIDEYVRVNSAPGALRAGFQLYATGLREDAANLAAIDRKLEMPVVVWGGSAFMGDVRPIWRTVGENVEGGVVAECGHFIPEEKPQFVIEKALEFFGPLTERR